MIRILLADDHAIVRAGIRSLLEGMGDVAVVAEAESGREALVLARQHQPDLMLLDISMKPLNGIDATVQLRREMPEARVLILSMHSTPEFVTCAIRAGANGYLVKDSAPAELSFAVASVMRGEFYLSPRISRHVVHEMMQATSTSEPRMVVDLSAPSMGPDLSMPQISGLDDPPALETGQPPRTELPRWVFYACCAAVGLAAALGFWHVVSAMH